MSDYRLYFLEDDRIRHVVVLSCDTDEDAIAEVEKHPDGRAKELWCGARVVKRFEAASELAGDPKR